MGVESKEYRETKEAVITIGFIIILMVFVVSLISYILYENSKEIPYNNDNSVGAPKTFIYIPIDDLNKSNPQIYVRDELGNFIKENGGVDDGADR